MKPRKASLLILAAAFAAGAFWCASGIFDNREIFIEKIAALDTGCGQGVAGAVGGPLENGGAFVFGGCNFPEKGPADGGSKKFYGNAWTLKDPKSGWVEIKDFAAPAGYGAAVETTEGTAIVGGCSESGPKTDAMLVKHEEDLGKNASALPPLPVPTDNFAAAAKDDWIFVAGGNAAGTPSKHAYVLRLDCLEEGWQPLPDFPGTPRVQPSAVCVKTHRGNAFVLIGGFWQNPETKEAVLPRDALIYYVNENVWETVPALTNDVSEAGLVGAAATVNPRGQIVVLGGVNAKIFKDAVEGKCGPDYLRHEPAWYRFNSDVLHLSLQNANPWSVIETVPETARAGATVIKLEDQDSGYLYVNGESMPGVRSTDVFKINFKKNY